ncbi:MAG: DMT family transporter [Burkholderiales bacterium]
MSPADLARLVGLAAVWGLAFVFIRVAVPPLGPVALTVIRTLVAGCALFLVARAIGVELGWRTRWRRFLAFGIVNSAIPFMLISAAEEVMTAAFAAILVATAPLFGALIAAVWAGEPLTARRVGGLLAGVAGVALLVGWNPTGAPLPPAWAIAATLGAAALFGVAANYTRLRIRDIPPLVTAAGSQLCAGALLLPLVAAVPPVAMPSAIEWASALALALLSSALAFLLYFRLIANVGAVKTLTVNFLSPLFGVSGGVLLLGEPVTANMVAGTAVILTGTALVLRTGR